MRHRLAIVALLAIVWSQPAIAQPPSAYALKDSNGNPFQVGVFNCGSDICPLSVSSDQAGSPLSGTVGTTNPNGTALFVQGVTGGVPVPITFAAPQHVICDSGCAGSGGGGLSVAFAGPIGLNGTPTGFKDGSGNFQSLLGDATNGQWVAIKSSVAIGVTGTFWPYTLGQQVAGSSVPVVLPAAQITALTPPTSVGISGTLPAFAATPTFNCGAGCFQATQPVSAASLPLPAGAATQTTLASILTALGSPFQAGASIGNTSFGISGTLPAFAATPTFNLGTLNGAATAANQTSVIGTAAAGTAATNAMLAGGQYNSSPITLTTTQQAALQVDANGFLKVNVSAGGASGGTSSSFGATFPSTGTASGMSQGGLMVALTGTSGNLNVQCANCSGSGVSTVDKASFTSGTSLFVGNGGFFQTTATSNPLTTGQQGMQQMTANRAGFVNLRDSSANELGIAASPLQVSLANTGANATGLLVTGTGGTFPVSQATAANLNATVVGTGTFAVQATIANPTGWGINTLGSATSGQSGTLALGAVTAAAPTYTTAQSNALSLTTAGALRVDGSSVTQPVSLASTTITGTVAVTESGNFTVRNVGNAGGILDFAGQNASSPGSAFLTGCQFNTSPTTITSGNVSPCQLDNAGNLKVNIVAGASSGAVAQGSTTSGQTGGLMQAAASSAAPTYTTATTNPLSTDLAGNLRVTVTSATGLAAGSTTSGQTGSMIMGAVTASPPSYATAQTNYLSLTPAGGLRVDGSGVTQPASLATLPATENHIGEVGNNQIEVTQAPTVTASAYTAGNAIGGLQTIAGASRVSGTSGASGTGGILTSLMMNVKSVQSTQVDVFIFNANPSGSTCTDHGAFVLAAADAAKVRGVLSIPATAANGAGWYSGGTGSLGMPIYYPLTFSLSSSTSLFACAVARGAFTPASTTDVAFAYNILRD